MKRPARVLSILAWVISSVLTVVDAVVLRTAVAATAGAIYRAIPIEVQSQRGWLLRWPVSAVDTFAIFCLSAAALGLVVSLDYVYQRAQAKGVLRTRFTIITTVQAAVLVLCGFLLLVLRRVV